MNRATLINFYLVITIKISLFQVNYLVITRTKSRNNEIFSRNNELNISKKRVKYLVIKRKYLVQDYELIISYM